jgi:predicted membrane chloride channel (bestrophin family)
MSECVNNLTATFGAMERINGTPLPFAYVSHLRSLLFINLGFTFLPMLSRDGLFALPGYLVLCWALLGIEAAAVECERPFQRKANHLAFGRFATVVASNIAQTVRVSALCSPRSPCTHVRKTDGIVRTAFEDVVVPPEEVLSPRSE